MGKALSGELSCPCDRSCLISIGQILFFIMFKLCISMKKKCLNNDHMYGCGFHTSKSTKMLFFSKFFKIKFLCIIHNVLI